jgi:hypothetical protein
MVSQHRWSFVRSGFPVWGALVLVCACAIPLVSDQGRGAQVVVVSVSGDWTPIRQDPGTTAKAAGAETQRPVRFGETLTVGAICLFGNEQGSIVLKFATPADSVLYPFPCEKANMGGAASCTTGPRNTCAVDLRKVGEKKGLTASFMATISEALARITRAAPEKYMVAASRGAEAELMDAVVPLEGEQIDLRAAFRDMDPGTYYVELGAVGAASTQGPPVRVSFAKGQAARAEARGVSGGLYKLALVTEKGEPGDSDCWILVGPPPEYAKQAASYDQAVSESTKLPAEMDAGATRALLRAYLESLASPGEGVTRP